MIQLTDIFIKYGDRVLYDHIDFRIEKGEKVGLVGRNGTGKSTLLRIISGSIKPDGGIVDISKSANLGFLTQELPQYDNISLKELALSAFEKQRKIEREIHDINTLIEHQGEKVDLSLFDRIAELHEQYELLGGHQMEGQVEHVLAGLGFVSSDFDKKLSAFSGGWAMRAELGRLLLSAPDILLLDEPTNHLDIESIIWLEKYLIKSNMTIIVISHDKTFLSAVTNKTAEIEFSKMEIYAAPYDKYLKLKDERREIQLSAYKNQQKLIAEKERTITRFMAKATKTKMAQSMKKQLDKLERIDPVDEEAATMNIAFPEGKRSGRVVLSGKNILKQYGEKVVLNDISIEVERNEKVAFVGQNGQGKTTLVKILCGLIDTSKGEVNLGHNVEFNYYAQNQADSLDNQKTLLQSLEDVSPAEMRTKLRSILGAFLFSGEDVDKKVSVLSGGERARLALAMMILRPSNLLILDEPTNHLDMLSKEVLKQAVQNYQGTVVIVSHDRDFLAGLCDLTYEFKDQKIIKYLGDINYFLEKKELEDMRLVEMRSVQKMTNSPEKSTASNAQVTHEEKRAKRKEMKQIERSISKFEDKIAAFELEMADPNFYNTPERDKKLSEYNELKSNLDDKMEVWEVCAAWLDEHDH